MRVSIPLRFDLRSRLRCSSKSELSTEVKNHFAGQVPLRGCQVTRISQKLHLQKFLIRLDSNPGPHVPQRSTLDCATCNRPWLFIAMRIRKQIGHSLNLYLISSKATNWNQEKNFHCFFSSQNRVRIYIVVFQTEQIHFLHVQSILLPFTWLLKFCDFVSGKAKKEGRKWNRVNTEKVERVFF